MITKFNSKLIKHNGYNFIKTYSKYKNTIINAGSEFRQIKFLQQILGKHEDWKEIKSILSKNCDYKLTEPEDEQTRLSDIKAMLERGNHKSATKKSNFLILLKKFTKEHNSPSNLRGL